MEQEAAYAHLIEWIGKFAGTALLGYLCCLLLCGKALHHMLQWRGLLFGLFIVPSCMLSGLLGFIFCSIFEGIEPKMTNSLINGLSLVQRNLLNFVFAALILGLSCRGRTSSQHQSVGIMGIFASLFHEGMPMLIYSQILGWGQTAICLFVVLCCQLVGCDLPSVYAAMIPLGLEAGTDISVTLNIGHDDWSLDVIEEAESLGLIITSLIFIFILSAKPYILASQYTTAANATQSRDSISTSQNSALVESFSVERATRASSVLGSTIGRGGSVSLFSSVLEEGNDLPDITGSLGIGESGYKSDGFKSERMSDKKSERASLGTHLSLIALTVFFSFLLSFCIRLLEIQLGTAEHRILSNLRMFKLAMFCAMFGMYYIQRRSRTVFSREWFMRISGLMLDLLVIAAFTVASPRPEPGIKQSHYGAIVLLVFSCVGWNLFCFFFLANRLFPNFWFERGLTLTGDSLGHSFLGLLFARTLDPLLESPVPSAYSYKLMLFFIPSSGEKNGVVLSLLESHGILMALIVSINIGAIWLVLCEKYFSSRFVLAKQNSHRSICVHSETSDSSDTPPYAEESGGFFGVPGSRQAEKEPSDTTAPVIQAGMSTGSNGPHITSAVKRSESVNKISSMLLTPDVSLSGVSPRHSLDVSEASSIVSMAQLATISSWLPENYTTKSWSLKYSLRRDGASAATMLMHCCPERSNHHVACVIIVEDSWGYIFGGFVSPTVANKTVYYGNGESLVFSMLPEPKVYKWTGKNDLFVLTNEHTIAMGGGGSGFAWQLDDELHDGVSNCSDTFDNPMLSSNEFFKCLNVEVWALDKMSFSV